ncbi:MAG: helix-hairpin-helix domain-containing protein [Bacilli bacterium]
MLIEKIKKIANKKIIGIIIIVILIVGYIATFIYFNNEINTKTKEEKTSEISIQEEDREKKEYKEIKIDIKGSVKKPGVYTLKENSRTNDAIIASGGLLKNANTRFINLSKILNDGDVIVIYSNEEIKKAQKEERIIVETPCICEEIKNDSCYKEDKENEVISKININTATMNELIKLNGIGESKAKLIIEYRTKNGKFKDIKEIMNIKGISETIFSKIKENITI